MEKEAVGIEKDDINERGKKEARPQRKSEARELLKKTHACYGDGLYCSKIDSGDVALLMWGIPKCQ